jgi:hypothetical protein
MGFDMDWDVVDIASSMFPYEECLHSGGTGERNVGLLSLRAPKGKWQLRHISVPQIRSPIISKLLLTGPRQVTPTHTAV